MKDRAQKLAELFSDIDTPDLANNLGKVISDQNKILAEALVRQNAETLIRVQQMFLEVLHGERAFVADVLNRQLAVLSVQAARTHATVSRATPPRSVNVSSQGQKSSSSAGEAASFSQGSEGQVDRPSTDDDETIVLSDIDPFGFSSNAGAGFKPGP